MRTAGPRYSSWFHQYDGHEVEQHAQRMHSLRGETKWGRGESTQRVKSRVSGGTTRSASSGGEKGREGRQEGGGTHYMPSSLARSAGDWRYSPSAGGLSFLRKGSIDLYCL